MRNRRTKDRRISKINWKIKNYKEKEENEKEKNYA